MTPDLTPMEAMRRLALPRSTFWREVGRGITSGQLKAVKYGRTYRFDAASIESFRAARLVASPADLRRAADGRRRS